MAIVDWLRENIPGAKRGPLIVSWSWKCDPETWVAKQLQRLKDKFKDG
jgi:hypothetical protein